MFSEVSGFLLLFLHVINLLLPVQLVFGILPQDKKEMKEIKKFQWLLVQVYGECLDIT